MNLRHLAVLAGAAACVLALHLAAPDIAAPEALGQSLAGAQARVAAHPVASAAAFVLVYVAVTAASVPVAIWLTLASGPLFGFGLAMALVLPAAATGASLAFLTSRYLFAEAVRDRFPGLATTVLDGVARDGARYLFTLRMIPAVPFFAVNLLMGLTRMRLPTFFLVSLVGMLPATAIYVNAGARLSEVHTPADVLSPAVALSLALAGLAPWLLRWAAAARRKGPQRAGTARPRHFDRNLVVIGGGAAGLVAAAVAAAARARVTLVEAGQMGGDCLNTGCVPSKALLRAAEVAHDMAHADRFGIEPARPKIEPARVFGHVRSVIDSIAPHDSAERYRALGVEVEAGTARLVDPWTVAIRTIGGGERRITARAIILATGAVPFVPDIPGLTDTGFLTTETLWAHFAAMPAMPERVIILGGGAAGVELAQALGRLGSQVCLLEGAPRLLPREDAEAAACLAARLAAEGVTIRTGVVIDRCGRTDGRPWVDLAGGASPGERLSGDVLILAVGRTARTEGLGLDALGIGRDGRFIACDRTLRTSLRHIFVAGDAAGPVHLTHAASHQAATAALNALAGRVGRLGGRARVLPRVVFTAPELAQAGLTEGDARAAGTAYEVTRLDLARVDRAVTDGAGEGLVKVLTRPGRDRILGVTIVGPRAGEVIAEFALAMNAGLGLKQILGTVHSYPTMADAARQAAASWRRAHLDRRALGLAERWHAWRRGSA